MTTTVLALVAPELHLPTPEVDGWTFEVVRHAIHARRELRESPEVVVCCLPPSEAAAFLAEVRGARPTTVRVAILPEGVPFDADLARVAHVVGALPLGAARLAAWIDLARGGDGLVQARAQVADIASLPVLPAGVRDVLGILDQPEVTIRQAAQAIERETVLAARVLSLANSAFYGLPRRVVTVRDAAAIVGLSTLRTTVLASGMLAMFDGLDAQAAEGIRAASTLRMRIARRVSGTFDDTAATSALLADVGQLALLARKQRPASRDLPLRARLAQEDAAYGADHALLGGAVLARWDLPDEVSRAVAWGALDFPQPGRGLDAVAAVRIARALADELGGGSVDLDPAWLRALGVAPETLEEWRDFCQDLALLWPAA